LRLGTPAGSGPGLLQRLEALGSLWEAIGDTRGRYMHLLPAAVTWAELGDLDEALLLPIEEPFLRAYGAAVRGIVARHAGDIASSAAALQEAEAGFRALDHLPGQFIVAWARAELLLHQGEAARAADSLDELAAHPILVSRAALQAALRASQICARAAAGDAVEVGPLLNRYTARPYLPPGQDLRVFTAVARFHAARGEWSDADAAYGRALEALRKLHETLAAVKPAWATRSLKRSADLLAEIRNCWERLGRPNSEARIAAHFPPAERLHKERAQGQQARNRRLHRIGLAINLLNLLIAIGIVIGLALAGPVRAGSPAAVARHPLIVRAAVLFLYAAIALVYAAILGVISLFRRQPASRGGRFTLFLAVLPWIGLAVLSVLDASR
jgi:tetratricopeptide (TPR) repeat protein